MKPAPRLTRLEAALSRARANVRKRHRLALRTTGALLVLLVGTAGWGCLGPSVPGDADGVRRRWFAPRQFQFIWANLPAIHGDVAMVADETGISAFDRATGAVRWRTLLFPNRTGGLAGDVVAVSGAACIADHFGGSGCVDVASGATIWTAPPDSAWSRQNAIDSSSVYYGTRDHRVVARSRVDGSVRWSADVAPDAPFLTMVSGVALRGDVLFATTQRRLNDNGFLMTGDLIALNRSTGKELWRVTDPGQNSEFFTAPVFAGNLAIVSDLGRHSLRAFDITTHRQVWETVSSGDSFAGTERPPALAGDTVFAASGDTHIHALDARTGALLWRVPGRRGSLGSAAVCGRFLLAVPWTSGPLVAVDIRARRVFHPNVLVGGDELFSRIAVDGTDAYVAGMKGVYSFRCAT